MTSLSIASLNSVDIIPEGLENFYEAFRLAEFITKDTTPDQFDEKCKKLMPDGYNLKAGAFNGYDALTAAAAHGNVRLVRHILSLGGPELVDIGVLDGWGHLFPALRNPDHPSAYLVTAALIESNANVNAVFHEGGLFYSTPLSIAVKIGNKLATKILLVFGAEVSPLDKDKQIHPLTDNEKQLIVTSAQENKVEAKQSSEEIAELSSLRELATLIQVYVGPRIFDV